MALPGDPINAEAGHHPGDDIDEIDNLMGRAVDEAEQLKEVVIEGEVDLPNVLALELGQRAVAEVIHHPRQVVCQCIVVVWRVGGRDPEVHQQQDEEAPCYRHEQRPAGILRRGFRGGHGRRWHEPADEQKRSETQQQRTPEKPARLAELAHLREQQAKQHDMAPKQHCGGDDPVDQVLRQPAGDGIADPRQEHKVYDQSCHV